MASPSCSSASLGDSHASQLAPVMPRTAWKSAPVKKMRPAYITPTKRLLFESEESASIVDEASSTWASE